MRAPIRGGALCVVRVYGRWIAGQAVELHYSESESEAVKGSCGLLSGRGVMLLSVRDRRGAFLDEVLAGVADFLAR